MIEHVGPHDHGDSRGEPAARLAAVQHATGALFNAVVVLDQRARTASGSGAAWAWTAIEQVKADLRPALATAARLMRDRGLPSAGPAEATGDEPARLLTAQPVPCDPAGIRLALRQTAAAATVLMDAITGRSGEDRWLAATACRPRPGWWPAIRAQLTPASPVFRHAGRLAVAGAIAVPVAYVLDAPHGAWLVSTTILVMKPSLGGTLRTASLRSAATVAGAAAAAALVALAPPPPVLVLVAFAVAAVAMAVMPHSYGLGILVVTPLSIVLTAVLVPVTWSLALVRVQDIAVGSLIAVAVSVALEQQLARPAALPDPAPGCRTGGRKTPTGTSLGPCCTSSPAASRAGMRTQPLPDPGPTEAGLSTGSPRARAESHRRLS